jgi:hypothetical protein
MNEFQAIAKNVDQIRKYASTIDTDPKKPEANVMKSRVMKGLQEVIVQLAVLCKRTKAHVDKPAKVELCPKCKTLVDLNKPKEKVDLNKPKEKV